MTALIWMLSWLPAVLPAVGKLPMPINVTLTSLNFTYILKWEAGPSTPEGVHYKVTYMPDRGYSWVPVTGCEHVQKPLVCNLTVAFSDLQETYFIMVKTHLGEQASPAGYSQYGEDGFKPISQLSLPLLSITPRGRDLRVDLHPPGQRLREIYDVLWYELQIRSSKDKPQSVGIQSLRTHWLENLAPGRRYCVAVRFNDRVEEIYSNFSQPQCAVIPATFPADPLISGVMCLVVIIIVAIIIMLIVTGYICLKPRPLPSVLTTIHNLDEVRVDNRVIISSLLRIEPLAPSAGEKRSSRSSSDESDEDCETESTGTSTGGAYTQRVGANPLSSSSSSSCVSQPKPLPDFSSKQLPYSQPDISTGSASRAGLEVSTDCGGRPKEEEEEDEAQDVNLLTLTFGRVEQEEEEEEEEEEEKSDLSVQQVEFDHRLPTEDSTATVHDDEEEEEEVSGYMGRLSV